MHLVRSHVVCWVACGLLSAWLCSAVAGAASPKIEFNRDVRPILSENCFACHGPDKNKRKAKLRLDQRDSALEKKAIVPGKPEESELVKRIFTTKEDDLMPPPESHKSLSAEQKELLEVWVAAGGEYEPHWAYILPRRPPVPKTRDLHWVQNPIDAFILGALEAKHITPSPAADRRVLLRRLSLDLIGLPPTAEELENYLHDSAANAYERQVDRLLQSPHYGERMAVPWLDVVRFTDTVGYHGDQNVNVFPYRDYVIDAFNRNKAFDLFTIEQLAGDLLPHPTTEQLIATGFNRLNMVTREGGAQPKEYLAKYAADRVRTVSMAWLGSTMGCTECHDHKYDPFSTKDFYSMEAFFADIQQWGVYQDYDYTPNPDLKGWSNDHPFPPEIVADSPYLQRRMARIEKRIEQLTAQSAAHCRADSASNNAFERWCDESKLFLTRWPNGWATPAPHVSLLGKDGKELPGTNAIIRADASILISGNASEKTRVDLPLTNGWIAAIQLELLPTPEHDGRILRGGGENSSVALTCQLETANSTTNLAFRQADADQKEERYSNGFAIIGVKDVWKTSRAAKTSPQTAVWILDRPLQARSGDWLHLDLGNTAVGCLRVSVTPFAGQNAFDCGATGAWTNALVNRAHNASGAEVAQLRTAYFLSTAWDRAGFEEFKKLDRDFLECRGGKSPTVVAVAWKPLVTRVLPRGNWQDETGAIVEPLAPHFLSQIPNPEHRRLTRLDLAKWLVSKENPLTARVVMNRLWKQFFGAGISAVVDDLGAQGEWPTHPELLDWLAVEWMESGWDLKHMVKLLVLSSAYRQDSNERPDLKEIDPGNRLFAYQSPRRLEAEFVRDNALAIAGLLNPEMGGPSVHPYQPGGYYANLQFPDRDYYPELDERQYRRGVYMHWQRTFLHPMLANFDAPSREECVAARTVSNTPQQALTLLNDPTFAEASRVFAEHLLAASPPGDEPKLDRAFKDALGRPIRQKEKMSLEQFLNLQRVHYQTDTAEAKKVIHVGLAAVPEKTDPVELAAWTQVCRVILNLHETSMRY